MIIYTPENSQSHGHMDPENGPLETLEDCFPLPTIVTIVQVCGGIYLVLNSNTLSIMWGPYLV